MDISPTNTLANKYRPKRFADVIGNTTEVTRLRGILSSKKIANAMLFIGPSGIGKTTLARLFGYYLNCDKLNRCGKCASCQTGIDNHPDIKELNAGDTRGIDDIRSLIGHARYRPQHHFRIILVDEVQALTPQAFSALLKPIEDPPGHTIWIFCSTNPEKIPNTITDRCTIFNLRIPNPENIAERLATICEKEEESKLGKNKDLLLKIANASGGSVRKAISILENTIQYVEGLGKEDRKGNLEKLVIENVLKGTTEDEDKIAVKLLFSIYKGSAAGVHASVAESDNLFALSNKILQLNLYAIDTLLLTKPNRNVWHTPLNKKFVIIVKDKLGFIQEEHTNLLYKIQYTLNELRLQLSSFMVSDRALMSTALALLAAEVKCSLK